MHHCDNGTLRRPLCNIASSSPLIPMLDNKTIKTCPSNSTMLFYMNLHEHLHILISHSICSPSKVCKTSSRTRSLKVLWTPILSPPARSSWSSHPSFNQLVYSSIYAPYIVGVSFATMGQSLGYVYKVTI